MSSSNDEDIIFGQELKVLISSADKERATKAVLQFLKGKSDKDLEEDDDIPLINRIPKRGHLNRGSSRGGRRRTVESSPLSNEGKAKKPIVHKDKYSQRTKLTESEISQLLNKSSSEGSAESSGEESEGNAGDVWTVANRQAGQSPQAVRAVARPIGKPQNLDGEPASNSMSSKKQKVSPIKLMRSKVNGTERSLSPGTQTDEINSVDSPTLSRLRNRSELKRRCWVESEDGSSGDGDMLTGRSETTPKKSTRTPRSIQNQDSPSSLRLRNRSELKRPSWLESEEDSADEIRTSTRKSKTSLRKATPQRTSIPLRDNVLSVGIAFLSEYFLLILQHR
ncbi:hypothetical protein AAG570_001612 [Ranatra chinensis]|uniref:Uncharacterized protein n=1 Tax=Ranatra chinensis TaxID=642074 RepID=A0ABD0Y913_9HEMI